MNNRVVCVEGTLEFEEEIRTQAINIISFNQGQQITINRDRLLPGKTLAEHMSQQLNNAEKVFNNFNFVKMEEMNEGDLFAETILIVFTFMAGPDKKIWQVTYASRVTNEDIINFTSIYPDENSMNNEISRLRHCVKKFKNSNENK